MIANNYLINFLATIQGHKTVTRGLQQIEQQTKRTQEQAPRMGMSYSRMFQQMMRRASVIIPVWILLRGAILGVFRVIGDTVRAHFELEEQMARIRTVMHGEAQEIEVGMIAIKRRILDMSTSTRIPLRDLAETFYFLKTASLDTEEAMAGFEAAVNLMTGTNIKGKEAARLIAGTYNTMGKYMDDITDKSEKMKKISDLLAYTYATQDVEMSELAQSYTKLAPYVSGLGDNFTELITMLGFLNTRLLRAGRTGRLTGRAMIQLSKNADKLAEIFGITFDSDKPLSFLKTIEKIHNKMGITEKITTKQSEALQKIFVTRGGVAVRLLIDHFDELQEIIKLAEEKADGFAESMAEIRMNTVTAQAERMKNIFAFLFEEFISGVYAVGDMTEAMKLLNDTMKSEQVIWRRAGQMLGWIGEQIGFSAASWNALIHLNWQELYNIPGIRSFTAYINEQEKEIKKITKEREKQRKILEDEHKSEEIRLNATKEESRELKHQTNLLKIMGANQLDIARYRLEALKNTEMIMTEEEFRLEKQKRMNDLVQAEEKFRMEILNTFQKAEITMLQAMGVSEFQIIKAKERQLAQNKEIIGDTQYLLELDKLRLQEAIAIERQKQKEEDLVMRFEEAGSGEKGRIRRAFELMGMSPDTLAQRYRTDMYDKNIIKDYWRYFTDEAHSAITEVVRLQERLPGLSRFGEFDRSKRLLGEAQRKIGYGREFATPGLAERAQVERQRRDIQMKLAGFGISVPIDNIIIKLPENSLDKMAEETGRMITERLKNDEALQKLLAKALRPYI